MANHREIFALPLMARKIWLDDLALRSRDLAMVENGGVQSASMRRHTWSSSYRSCTAKREREAMLSVPWWRWQLTPAGRRTGDRVGCRAQVGCKACLVR